MPIYTRSFNLKSETKNIESNGTSTLDTMMKSVKRALRRVLRYANVCNKKLNTAICTKESLLNSTHGIITYVSADTNDVIRSIPNLIHYLCELRGGFTPDFMDDEAVKPRKGGKA